MVRYEGSYADLPPATAAQRPALLLFVIALALLLGVLLFTLSLFSGTASAWLQHSLVTILWLAAIAGLALWGYASGAMRLYAYAALLLAALLASFWVELPLYSYAWTVGAGVAACGLVLAVRFVRSHPKLIQMM